MGFLVPLLNNRILNTFIDGKCNTFNLSSHKLSYSCLENQFLFKKIGNTINSVYLILQSSEFTLSERFEKTKYQDSIPTFLSKVRGETSKWRLYSTVVCRIVLFFLYLVRICTLGRLFTLTIFPTYQLRISRGRRLPSPSIYLYIR